MKMTEIWLNISEIFQTSESPTPSTTKCQHHIYVKGRKQNIEEAYQQDRECFQYLFLHLTSFF